MTEAYLRPTPMQLVAARGKRVPDLIDDGLKVLFCGINPSLYSAVVGHHFARPGNRFWKVLHGAGFTPRVLHPSEDAQLLELGIGLTNVYWRATATAAELTPADYVAGKRALQRKVRRYQPAVLAFLGVEAYRVISGQKLAVVGAQPEPMFSTPVWALPNPSGLNAHYQLAGLSSLYAKLALELGFR